MAASDHLNNIVGLTGGIASGKSLVGRLFSRLGVPVTDTDDISRALTAPNGLAIPAIQAIFGADSLDETGAMQRERMREHIFHHPEAKQQLEHILHPLILQESQRLLQQHASAPYQILTVPLLFETSHFLPLVNRTLVVDTDPEQQISRAMSRSQLDRAMVQRIMAQQFSRQQRLARADDIIDNRADEAHLWQQVSRLHEKYLSLGGATR
jgi:dephospho-CoA kinase